MTERTLNWQGKHWIRDDKRLAIYLRDGLACAYCGATIEQGAQFSLDHVTPHSHGGTNHESNLVTACSTCNASRGNKSVEDYACYLSPEHATEIVEHVESTLKKPLAPFRKEAKKIIARRANFTDALKGLAHP